MRGKQQLNARWRTIVIFTMYTVRFSMYIPASATVFPPLFLSFHSSKFKD